MLYRPFVTWVPLATLTFLIACGPKIHQLRVEPNVVCPGTTVVLSWDATMEGTLAAAPRDSTLGAVSASGCTHVTPATTTRYSMEVHNLFGSDRREVDVDVRTDGGVQPVGASVADPSASCDGGRLSVTALLARTYWAAGLVVTQVKLPDEVHREIHVEHAGRTATLEDHSRETHEFDGTIPSGKWRLTTSLASTESCGTPNLPHNLSVALGLGCVE